MGGIVKTHFGTLSLNLEHKTGVGGGGKNNPPEM